MSLCNILRTLSEFTYAAWEIYLSPSRRWTRAMYHHKVRQATFILLVSGTIATLVAISSAFSVSREEPSTFSALKQKEEACM